MQSLADVERLEAELRIRLAGYRVVLEAGIEDERAPELWAALDCLIVSPWYSAATLSRRFPAVVVCALVAHGALRYGEDGLWPSLEERGHEANVLRAAFEQGLVALELDEFEEILEQGAFRFVSRILAHGGIPSYYLDHYFQGLEHGLARGLADATDFLAGNLLNYWSKRPVVRYLRFGGPAVRDFINRSIELLAAPVNPDVRLPARITEAAGEYASGATGKVERAASTAHLRVRPEVRFDPWAVLVPTLVLPPLPAEFRQHEWVVWTQGGAQRLPASRADETHLQLGVAPSWVVELREAGSVLRRFVLGPTAAQAAYIFAGQPMRLIQSGSAAPSGELTVIRPHACKLSLRAQGASSPPFVVAQCPPLPGEWSRFLVEVVRVASAGALWVEHDDVRQSVPVGAGARLRFVSDPNPHFVTAEGDPVHDFVPRIAFVHERGVISGRASVRVTVNGTTETLTGDDLERRATHLLRDRVDEKSIALVEIAVRDTLGADEAQRFVYVPGLDVEVPAEARLPGRAGIRSRVRAEQSIWLNGQRGACDVLVGGADFVELDVADGTGEFAQVRLRVPRVKWRVAGLAGSAGSLAQLPVTVRDRELEAVGPVTMVIQTGQPGEHVDVALLHDFQRLRHLHLEARGLDGLVAVDLREFLADGRAGGAVRYRLLVRIAGENIHVADLRVDPQLRIRAVHVTSLDGHRVLEVLFSQAFATSTRVLRAWALARPCAPALELEVPAAVEDGRWESCPVPADELPPGPYRLELVAPDVGTRNALPDQQELGVVDQHIGTVTERLRWADWLAASLRVNAIGELLPLESESERLAELLLLGSVDIEIPARLLDEAAPHLALALAELLRTGAPEDLSPLGLAAHLATSPARLTLGLRHVAEASLEPDRACLIVTLAVLSQLHDVALSLSAAQLIDISEVSSLLSLRFARSTDREIFAFGLDEGDDGDVACQREPPLWGMPAMELQRFMGRTDMQLVAMEQALNPLPRAVLDQAAVMAAHFEWLRARTANDAWTGSWVGRHEPAIASSTAIRTLPEPFQHALAPTRTQRGPVIIYGAEARLLEVAYAAACHVIAQTSTREPAVRALAELTRWAPKLVRMTLAQAILVA